MDLTFVTDNPGIVLGRGRGILSISTDERAEPIVLPIGRGRGLGRGLGRGFFFNSVTAEAHTSARTSPTPGLAYQQQP